MLAIRPLSATDVPFGLSLSGRAGWNQCERDWQRFLAIQPDGCFLAEWSGVPVGTTAAFVFGDVGWVAMVLVAEDFRRRGIGRALVQYALAFLDRQGVTTVRLDATPQGQPMYESLGFTAQFQLARYAGLPAADSGGERVEPARPQDWAAIAELDRSVTGTDRSKLLSRLLEEQPDTIHLARDGERLSGYVSARPGARATLLGPCIAAPEAGPRLMSEALGRHQRGAVFVDVPVANAAGCRLVERHGLTVQRLLTRMCRGVPRCERLDWLWASSGPEKG